MSANKLVVGLCQVYDDRWIASELARRTKMEFRVEQHSLESLCRLAGNRPASQLDGVIIDEWGVDSIDNLIKVCKSLSAETIPYVVIVTPESQAHSICSKNGYFFVGRTGFDWCVQALNNLARQMR